MIPAVATEYTPLSALVRPHECAGERLASSLTPQVHHNTAAQAAQRGLEARLSLAEIKEVQDAITAGPRLLLERRVEETYRSLRSAERDAVTSAEELAESSWWDRFNGLRDILEMQLALDQARISKLSRMLESYSHNLHRVTVAQKHVSQGKAGQSAEILREVDTATQGTLKIEPVVKRLEELQTTPQR